MKFNPHLSPCTKSTLKWVQNLKTWSFARVKDFLKKTPWFSKELQQLVHEFTWNQKALQSRGCNNIRIEKNIITNYIWVMGLNFRIYKEMQKLNTKNLNHLIYKCLDEVSILLLKVQIQMVKKYFKTVQYTSHQWTQLNYQEMKLAQMSTNRWED